MIGSAVKTTIIKKNLINNCQNRIFQALLTIKLAGRIDQMQN